MMKLKKIVIASVETEKMVRFYNGVFASGLEPFEAFGTVLYRGQLAGIELLLCPNEFLGIKAEKNRQQLSFVVDDLEAVLENVQRYGGEKVGEIQQNAEGGVCGVKDPDGNTIEFVDLSN